MLCHIWSRQMASLLYGSFHVFFKEPLSVNVLTHLGQAKGFSPVWVFLCLFKVPICANALSHWEQANGFSPVWVLSCFFKLTIWVNNLSHLEHANGSSPVWILSCVFKLVLLNHCISRLVLRSNNSLFRQCRLFRFSCKTQSIVECFVTFGTSKWLLTCVGHFVNI